MTLRAPAPAKVDDAATNRALDEHRRAIGSVMSVPLATAVILPNVTLADGVATPIAHGLGRAPLYVRESCVRGAAAMGFVEEVRSSAFRRETHVVLRASNFAATVTVDVLVA